MCPQRTNCRLAGVLRLHLVRQLVPGQFHFFSILHVRHVESLAFSRNFQSAITEQCANNRPTDLKATDAIRV